MKVLIELPTWLGDCIMATPAIENIVNLQNDAEITKVARKMLPKLSPGDSVRNQCF